MENREAMICAAHTETVTDIDIRDVLYMPDSYWSIAQESVQAGNYLASSVATGLMNDHEILVELLPCVDHFVSIPIECADMDRSKGQLCMLLGSCQRSFHSECVLELKTSEVFFKI